MKLIDNIKIYYTRFDTDIKFKLLVHFKLNIISNS